MRQKRPFRTIPFRKEAASMDNENKWEYDYSSEHNPTGETGYPNVGSSGMNTANTAGTYSEPNPAAQPETASGENGGATPLGPNPMPHRRPPSPRRSAAGIMARSPAVPWHWCWRQPWALSAASWVPGWATQAAR